MTPAVAEEVTRNLFIALAVAPHQMVKMAGSIQLCSERDVIVTVGYKERQPVRRFQDYVLFANGQPCCSWTAKYDRWRILINPKTQLSLSIRFVLESFGYVT